MDVTASMKVEYLLFNLVILVLPIAGVILVKGAKWPNTTSVVKGLLFFSVPYVIVDYFVTDYWWSFNERYVTGITIGKLPIEELLFFVTVPWSCLVIWENLKRRIPGEWSINVELWVIVCSIMVSIYAGSNFWWYTLAISGVVVVVALVSYLNGHWMHKKNFAIFQVLVIVLTLIFNGYLTARPIVLYSADFMSNMRIGTIPLEDIFYGLALINGVVILYERYNSKKLESSSR